MNQEISLIPVGSLKFDPENPRLPASKRKKVNKVVIQWMLLDASLLDLVSSIAQNGFFSGEPLLVTKDDSNPREYIVIEGNRRLAASLILNNPTISTTKAKAIKEILNESNPSNIPSNLPCIVFSNKDEIIDYLGYRHVTGVQSWGPLAKARYLNLLFSRLKGKSPLIDKCRTLAKKIGSKANVVRQLLVGYWLFEIMEEEGFYGIKGLDEESIEFSHLYDSIRYKGLRSFLNVDFDKKDPLKKVDTANFKEFTHWLFDRAEGQSRLGDSRNLKVLDKVVQSNEALKHFRAGKSLAESSNYSDYPEELFSEHILKALELLKEATNITARIEGKCSEVDFDNIKQIRKFGKILFDQNQEDDF